MAIPKTRHDIVRIVEICRRFRCPITMRGGGTSQAGQAIGEGLQVDISKYYNRVLEVNAEERWARVEPGIVLDELNAQLAPLAAALRARYLHRQPRHHWRHDGEQLRRRAQRDLRQDHRSCAGADRGPLRWKRRRVPGNPACRGSQRATRLRPRCTPLCCGSPSEHASEIERRYPKVLRRVGGYNLDEFTDPPKPVNLSKLMVGSEGTLGVVLEAKLKLVPLPKAKAVMVISFADLLESLAAAPVILKHNPSAIEVMDKSILDYTRQNENLNNIRNEFIEGDPASILCVEFYGDRAEDLPPRLEALEADLRAQRSGPALSHRNHPARRPTSGACAKPLWGSPWP